MLKKATVAIGERIRELRTARGLSQDQLAEAAGVQQSAISRLERETIGDPGVLMLAGIADALEVTVDALLGPERLPGALVTTPPEPPAARLERIEAELAALQDQMVTALKTAGEALALGQQIQQDSAPARTRRAAS